MIDAVIFDLDGVLIDSEGVWSAAREQLVRERGGSWHPEAVREMMGMSSPEWSRDIHDQLGVAMAPARIARERVRRPRAADPQRLPLPAAARQTGQQPAERGTAGARPTA